MSTLPTRNSTCSDLGVKTVFRDVKQATNSLSNGTASYVPNMDHLWSQPVPDNALAFILENPRKVWAFLSLLLAEIWISLWRGPSGLSTPYYGVFSLAFNDIFAFRLQLQCNVQRRHHFRVTGSKFCYKCPRHYACPNLKDVSEPNINELYEVKSVMDNFICNTAISKQLP